MRLNESTFIITGVDSPGAAAIARRFHASGAHLVLLGPDEPAARNLVLELGTRVAFQRVTLSNEDEVREAVNHAVATGGSLDGLVHCLVPERASGDRAEVLAGIARTDILGVANLIRSVAEVMRRQPHDGVIVNLSMNDGSGCEDVVARAARTAGICAMSVLLAPEMAAIGIRLITIAISPGLRPVLFTHPTEIGAAIARETPLSIAPREDEVATLVQTAVEHDLSNSKALGIDVLSRRQLDVLRLVARGKRNREIGDILGISERTVQVHVSKVFDKIGVDTRTGAGSWLTERLSRDDSVQWLESLVLNLQTPSAELQG